MANLQIQEPEFADGHSPRTNSMAEEPIQFFKNGKRRVMTPFIPHDGCKEEDPDYVEEDDPDYVEEKEGNGGDGEERDSDNDEEKSDDDEEMDGSVDGEEAVGDGREIATKSKE